MHLSFPPGTSVNDGIDIAHSPYATHLLLRPRQAPQSQSGTGYMAGPRFLHITWLAVGPTLGNRVRQSTSLVWSDEALQLHFMHIL